MDPVRNPFAPGAGSPPPELAGRSVILEAASLALRRVQLGRPEQSQMLLGLRGVGKTVLLARIAGLAEELGCCELIILEAPEGQSLASYLVPALRATLLRLSRLEQAKALALQSLSTLRSFAAAFKVSVGEIKLGLSEPPAVLADSGNLEVDLPELLLQVAQVARAAGRVLVVLLDEVQYLSAEELRSLIVALHRAIQKGLPVILFGAGLPQVAALAGEAKSYAERLFAFPELGPLPPEAAAEAVREPVEHEGAAIEPAALAEIVERTQGCPPTMKLAGRRQARWPVG